ncbi:MAG: type II toxin-antitoxin system VapC family toxin [Candidatus Kapabacteria bacterium]|nr:type II toxin-antitoxin system VapC family toxin [Candidatus Kapabacteria bacterium]
MAERYLIDTDVIIDYLRTEPHAVEFLESSNNEMLISAITVAELYSGIRNQKEKVSIGEFIKAFDFIPINSEIAEKGGLIRKEFGKSFGIGLADSLIAATSIITKSKIVSLNHKHFQMFDNILIPYRKP